VKGVSRGGDRFPKDEGESRGSRGKAGKGNLLYANRAVTMHDQKPRKTPVSFWKM